MASASLRLSRAHSSQPAGAGGIAQINIGDATETEVEERKTLIEGVCSKSHGL